MAPLRYLSIELSDAGIAEMDGQRRIVFVPLDEIRHVQICHGFTVEHPIRQFTFGLCCIFIGLVAIGLDLVWFEQGGIGAWAMLPGGVIALLFGLGVIGLGLRRKHYLRVVTNKDERKVLLHGPFDVRELLPLLESANEQWGYRVTSALPGLTLDLSPRWGL